MTYLWSLALTHTTTFCCSAVDCDGTWFNLDDLLPGKLVAASQSPSPIQTQKWVHNIYRPTQERPLLMCRLVDWLKKDYLADPYRSTRPVDLILTDAQRTSIVRTDPDKLKCAQDITTLLGESDEWGAEWAEKIFGVLTRFDHEYACIAGQSNTQRKQKRKE